MLENRLSCWGRIGTLYLVRRLVHPHSFQQAGCFESLPNLDLTRDHLAQCSVSAKGPLPLVPLGFAGVLPYKFNLQPPTSPLLPLPLHPMAQKRLCRVPAGGRRVDHTLTRKDRVNGIGPSLRVSCPHLTRPSVTFAKILMLSGLRPSTTDRRCRRQKAHPTPTPSSSKA